jgi:uncharacterized Tic20 family protein
MRTSHDLSGPTLDPVPPEERTWAVLAHAGAVPFPVLAPLLVMVTAGRRSVFVRRQALESLNFGLTVLFATVASAILFAALIGPVLLAVVAVAAVVLPLVGAVRAGQGAPWRYPASLRLVRDTPAARPTFQDLGTHPDDPPPPGARPV